VLTDGNGGSVRFKSIETLIVGSYTYTENASDDTYWSSSEYVLHMYDGGSISSSGLVGLSGFNASSNMTIYGSSSSDSMNLNIDRSDAFTGNLTIALGAGNDSISSAKLKDGDSVDMGGGDDVAYIMIGGSSGTPTLSAADISKLDGGSGTDLIAFTESTGSNGQTLLLTTAGATNFENLLGSNYEETLQGDANDNWIAGDGGVDTLYGYAGNDRLAAGGYSIFNYGNDDPADPVQAAVNASSGQGSDNDVLYGGAGNDSLYGSTGDNILDGGTGTDTIFSGTGSDTIVIRSGDGSAVLADADVLRDFSDGSDVIGMDGLNFGDLTISQGTGDYANHVVVQFGAEYLLVIQNESLANLTSPDFTPL